MHKPRAVMPCNGWLRRILELETELAELKHARETDRIYRDTLQARVIELEVLVLRMLGSEDGEVICTHEGFDPNTPAH